jgi:uncharacterized membrane protein (DUF485 family)
MNLREFSRRRWRVVGAVSAPLLVLYLGFMLLIAFDRKLAATLLVPGLSVAILLGSLVIVGTWFTTWLYVRWTERHLDQQIRELRANRPAA